MTGLDDTMAVANLAKIGQTRRRPVDPRLWIAAIPFAACWSIYPWLWSMWTSPVETPASGAISMAVSLYWLWLVRSDRMQRRATAGVVPVFWPAAAGIWLLLYAVSYHRIPQMIAGGMAYSALACAMIGALSPERRRESWGLWPLMVFSLPVNTSYFLAYPLRLVVGKIAALLLGTSITPQGTGLTNGAFTVFIDAPCSGIRMLSTALLLASFLAVLLRLTFPRAAALLFVGFCLAVLGNAVRASSLFILAAAEIDGVVLFGVGDWFEVSLEAVTGLIAFFACCLVLICAAKWLARKERNPKPTIGCPVWAQRVALGFLLLGSAAAAASPLLHAPRSNAGRGVHLELTWPKFWNGARLLPVSLFSEPRIIDKDFPGVMAQFRIDGSNATVLLRATRHVTRLMHPGELCFKTQGWRVSPAQAWQDEHGHTWNRFRYEKPDGERGIARQAYFTFETAPESEDLRDWLADAKSWPDAAGWYWDNAVAGKAPRLTVSVILSRPAD